MHADLSRWTFDAALAYRAVLLQQGRVMLDADINEQAEITAHHDEVRAADLIGRSGGPAAPPSAAGEAGVAGVAALGPFAVVGPDGTIPQDASAPAAWGQLRVTPGRYYVDGVLAESPDPPPSADGPGANGWRIADQPYLATIGTGKDAAPGLPEPDGAAAGDRFMLYLDVWDHHVTPEEEPALLEPALGGPDTTTRLRTVWQVKAAPLPAPANGGPPVTCSDLHAAAAVPREPRLLVASLEPPGPDADPCLITSAGGYQRLENQLYRVQIHAGRAGGGDPAFLWSRDNGIVRAGLTGLEVSGTDTTLTLDRLGRDEELSFTTGCVVEVTSTDLELREQPGFLGTAGVPEVVTDAGGSASALRLPVTWLAGSPASLEALGRAPIVRRWDGGPLPLVPDGGAAGDPVPLESGIQVAFPSGGQAIPGDFWLIPARTVRLSYGLSQLSGTIVWPSDGRGPAAQPPVGPVHHVTPLAVVRRVDDGDAAVGWVVDSDCRLLFPAATSLAALDLLGGDGQLALPGRALPKPVRVAVRAGSLPVAGAALGVDAGPGTVSGAPVTGPDGVAAFGWTLDPRGPLVQTLRISRLDDHGVPAGAAVVVTGRLCVPMLRLAGGDGQEVESPGRCVPQPVRVVLDSACGPLAGAQISASAAGAAGSPGFVVAAVPGEPVPAALRGPDASATAVGVTGPDGAAEFWWQPGVDPNVRSATLDLSVTERTFVPGAPEAPPRDPPQAPPRARTNVRSGASHGSAAGQPSAPAEARTNVRSGELEVSVPGALLAPLRVTAQLDPAGGQGGGGPDAGGLHVTLVAWGTGRPFRNDTLVSAADLASGIDVLLDGDVAAETVRGKPVARLTLELPWPLGQDGASWVPRVDGLPRAADVVGFRDVQITGEVAADRPVITWRPRGGPKAPPADFLTTRLWDTLGTNGWDEPIVGRFVIDGWAVAGLDGQPLNGHARTELAPDGRTNVVLPTDNAIPGGEFRLWFRVQRGPTAAPRGEGQATVTVPDVTGRTQPVATRLIEAAGLTVGEVTTEPSDTVRGKLVIRTEPPAGASVAGGSAVAVVVSAGRAG